MTARILVVEQAPGLGGSTIALGRLLAALPTDRYEFVVAVQHEVQRRHLEGLGIPGLEIVVVPLVGAHPTEMPVRRSLVARLLGVPAGVARLVRRHGPAARALSQLVRERKIALVHLNNSVSANLAGFWAGWRRGVPCVVKQRGYEWNSADIRWVARRIGRYLADSGSIRDDLRQLGIAEDRIVVNYAPIDPRPFETPFDRDAVRSALGIAPGAVAFGIVGCLQRWKGQEVFLDAAARVLAERQDAVALVVGGGDDLFEPEYGPALRARAERLGITDRVRFTGHRKDIPDIVRALDVCVHASLEPEPFGMVVSEAMVARRPVIATRTGGPEEQVEDGVTGFLTAPGDAAALAVRLLRLTADPALRERMGEQGRLRVLARFTAAEHARVTAEVYDAILAG
jgi:glycosyltransferase involved in cell wall biosynthesis